MLHVSESRIRHASGPVDGIKLKLSVCVEGDVEETKGFYAYTDIYTSATIATVQAMSIKVKLLRNI